ncbi:hypothetical protein [Micromonospora maritima]|uniref:hypothetical protein n=1 Tax=Micromonospora maritima TaxID=986711 RepID=UPI00157D3692|nr:hypothetical protein [Micromonospora maritima]
MTSESPTHEGKAVDQARQDYDALRAVGELFPDTALAESSRQLERGGDWPENLRDAPLVVDAGSAWGPGTVLAVAAAGRGVPRLALVIVGDEPAASAARRLLDRVGRPEVGVVFRPAEVPAAVRSACGGDGQPIRWAGLGEPLHLAQLIPHAPDLAGRLRVTQSVTGGRLVSPDAARTVLDAVREGRIAALDLVGGPEGDGPAADHSHRQAMALVEALDETVDRSATAAVLDGSVVLSAAVMLPFVDVERAGTAVDAEGRFRRGHDGVSLWWGAIEDHDPLVRWLSRVIEPSRPDREA